MTEITPASRPGQYPDIGTYQFPLDADGVRSVQAGDFANILWHPGSVILDERVSGSNYCAAMTDAGGELRDVTAAFVDRPFRNGVLRALGLAARTRSHLRVTVTRPVIEACID